MARTKNRPESHNDENFQQNHVIKMVEKKKEEVYSFKMNDIAWRNVLIFAYMHAVFLYSFYLLFTGQARFISFVFAYSYAYLGAFGITAGAHRLWSHSSYKAKLPMRIILVALNCIAFQNCIYEWVRDHRVHHKYTDTNADPHNYSRGFFFAHMGWLMLKKHPDVKTKGKLIDMSDMERDPLVMWQKKHYLWLMPLFSMVIPAMLMSRLTGESPANCWHIAVVWRYLISLHLAWLVNSAAHSLGTKPFDGSIKPTDNIVVAFIAQGEGWHNYHHIFPWDYKTGELGNYDYNAAGEVIELFAKIGWAYDLRTVSLDMIKKRATRTGDGSIFETKVQTNNNDSCVTDDGSMIWGWNDDQMPAEYKIDAIHTKSA